MPCSSSMCNRLTRSLCNCRLLRCPERCQADADWPGSCCFHPTTELGEAARGEGCHCRSDEELTNGELLMQCKGLMARCDAAASWFPKPSIFGAADTQHPLCRIFIAGAHPTCQRGSNYSLVKVGSAAHVSVDMTLCAECSVMLA